MTHQPAPIQFVENVMKFDDTNWDGARIMRPDLPPGAAHWMMGEKHVHLDFTCPCGCGVVHCIEVNQGEKKQGSWLWDGNVEKPTLLPSIACKTPCAWHGYLTAGVFTPC